MSVWKGSRGLAGKTFLMALLTLVEGLTLKIDVNLLGGSGGQSTLGLRYLNDFLTGSNIVQGGLATNVSHETRLQNGAFLRALMASQTSVRGPHPVRLRLDEVDEMDLDIFDASLGQPMSKNGVLSQVTASSTHQYPDGTMTEVLKRAGAEGWPCYEWCFRESQASPHGWLSQAEVDRKRSQVPKSMWSVEYELQEPSTEGRAIDTASVALMFDRSLGAFEGKEGERIEIEAPVPNVRYAHGADWARKVDYTDIGTLKLQPKQHILVAFERMRRRPWDLMVERFALRLKRYGGEAAHDATGLGDVVDRMLQLTGQKAEPVMFVGRERKDVLSEYVAAVEQREIRAPFIRSMESEHRYCTVDDLYGAGHPPDSVVMGALAYRASRKKRAPKDIALPAMVAPSGWGFGGNGSREAELD